MAEAIGSCTGMRATGEAEDILPDAALDISPGASSWGTVRSYYSSCQTHFSDAVSEIGDANVSIN